MKQKIAELKVGDKISVVEIHAEEEYGTFKSSGQDDFAFYDVDRKHDVTLPYAQVKKVKNGYGGDNRQQTATQTTPGASSSSG